MRSALQNMHQAGALNDADIARLVERWALDSGDFSSGVAQLFSGMKGPEALDMQNAFPASPEVIDVNADGLIDVMFAVDIAGHVWRFDMNPDTESARRGVWLGRHIC